VRICGLGSLGSGYAPVAGCYEHENGTSDSIKDGEILETALQKFKSQNPFYELPSTLLAYSTETLSFPIYQNIRGELFALFSAGPKCNR
jgi:hypothetical protein